MSKAAKFAFPSVAHDFYPGLTKREYFAAMALQGLLAGRAPDEPLLLQGQEATYQADALIEALEKGVSE